MFENKQLSVSEILLDQHNPRFSPVASQREAVAAMLKEQGDKLYNLADDIARYGLDPSKRLIVFKEKGNFIDGDGNRRLTALKILETPELVNYDKRYKKFKSLSKNYKVPSYIDCVVFESRDSIRHWLDINHGGEQKGRGQISWRAGQKERFNGGISIGYLAKEKLREENIITDEEYDAVNVTTLSRLLESKPGKKALSIIKNREGEFVFNDLKSLQSVYGGLIGKSVKEVYHDEDRKKFLMNVLGGLDPKIEENNEEVNDSKDYGQKDSGSRVTKRRNLKNEKIFGEKLVLKPGLVNNIYRDICDIYELSKKNDGGFVEILGFSMRLILDTAAREYFERHPEKDIKSDAVYNAYIKEIKSLSDAVEVNTLKIDTAIVNIINEEKVEALLAKLAHNSVKSDIGMVLKLSYIVGKILKVHFS